MAVRVATSVLLALSMSACSTIDRGSFGPFKRSLNTKSYGYSVSKDPTNAAPTEATEVFTVKPGDCGSSAGWSDCATDRERSELAEVDRSTYPGSEHWYGWSVYFPRDYPNVYPTKTALGQFHQDKSHVVWMFQNADGGYHLDDQVHGSTRKYYKLLDESELRGRWHKIEIHARWARDESGFFKVWVNGENKVDYAGQTMEASSIYFKYGVYRTFLSRYKNAKNVESVPAQTAYFSNVKRGRTRDALLP